MPILCSTHFQHSHDLEEITDLEAYSNNHAIWIATVASEHKEQGETLSIELTAHEAVELYNGLGRAIHEFIESIGALKAEIGKPQQLKLLEHAK